MARNIKITSGVLNISLHPHPEGVYGDYIESLFKLKTAVRIRGEKHAVISLLSRGERDEGIYTGFITTFIKINTDEPWFDLANMSEATDEDLSEISIPESIYPNAATFQFLFDANKHRLYIQTYSKGKTLSMNSVFKLFSGLSSDLKITQKFGEASINIVQSKNALNTIFSLKVIKSIVIVITKPNADVFEDDFEEKVEGYLAELHSRKMKIELEAEAGKSLTPNASLRRISDAALDYGHVQARGRDERGATQISTKDFPEELHDKYDPDNETENTAFRRLIGK